MRSGRVALPPAPYLAEPARLATRELQALLPGPLAAGWNAGAAKLGAKLPAWVSRHGSGRSAISVVDSIRVFRITLTNAVKYVTNVADYGRRVQSAINIQAAKMRRRAEFLLTRALKRAGWK